MQLFEYITILVNVYSNNCIQKISKFLSIYIYRGGLSEGEGGGGWVWGRRIYGIRPSADLKGPPFGTF